MKRKNITTPIDSTLPPTDPAELQDGRYKEWQDRARVNLDKADPDQQTSIERDFEEEEAEDKDENKFY
ncbi:MAG: hypothetical protein ACXWV5_02735 [Flavitalea sp.]